MGAEHPTDPKITYVALESIGRAISDLSRPRGTMTLLGGPIVGAQEDMYAIGRCTPDRLGVPPYLWPEVIAVTEALIGCAFVVAQTYVKSTGKQSPTIEDIEHVANYFKHREEWDSAWSFRPGCVAARTIGAVRRLGAQPPVVLGQLEKLAGRVLRPFSADELWKAIA